MTTEIAVANKWGIAIAADSAATVEQLVKDQVKEKVYNSANKLFTLSKWRPVGAMVYNTLTLGGKPWEIIIKAARKELSDTEHKSLQDYASFLSSFLNSSPELFPEDGVDSIVQWNVYRILKDLYDKGATHRDFSHNLDVEISKLQKVEKIEGFDADFERLIYLKHADAINKGTQLAVPEAHRRNLKTKIKAFLLLSFTIKKRLQGYSGVVVCGYGKEDIFPVLVEFYTDIMIAGRVRLWKANEDMRVCQAKRAFVRPFADTEAISTITQGVNPSFQRELVEQAIEMVSGLPEIVLARVTELNDVQKEAYAAQATQALIAALKTFVRKMGEFRQEQYVLPIEQTLEVLPLSELAGVAETLVSIAQIHKRINPDTETVGGPIDVAVISKGDGFIWIKRKHYFDKQHNHAYFKNYLDK